MRCSSRKKTPQPTCRQSGPLRPSAQLFSTLLGRPPTPPNSRVLSAPSSFSLMQHAQLPVGHCDRRPANREGRSNTGGRAGKGRMGKEGDEGKEGTKQYSFLRESRTPAACTVSFPYGVGLSVRGPACNIITTTTIIITHDHHPPINKPSRLPYQLQQPAIRTTTSSSSTTTIIIATTRHHQQPPEEHHQPPPPIATPVQPVQRSVSRRVPEKVYR